MKRKTLLSKSLLLAAFMVGGVNSVWAQDTYELVTDASTLQDGDVVIFATSTGNGLCYAMGGANGSNNRKAVDVTVASFKITTRVDNVSDTQSKANTKNTDLTHPYEVTLVKSGDNWNLIVIEKGEINCFFKGLWGLKAKISLHN